MKEVSLLDMLKAGVHFGHQTARWHPKMKPFIFSARNGVHIIDLEKTAAKLQEALGFVGQTAKSGGQILFLGTKRQCKEIIKKWSEHCQMPYINEKWLGGTFTNFANIAKLVKRLKELRKEFKTGEIKKYSKKERSVYQSELDKLEKLVSGLTEMNKLPQAIFLIDAKEEKTAVREARKKKIPIIAIADTNVDPDLIDYPIPGNDDATKSIEFFTSLIAETIAENYQTASVKKEKPKASAKGGSQPKADQSSASTEIPGEKKKAQEEKAKEVKVKDEVKQNIENIEEKEKEVKASDALKS